MNNEKWKLIKGFSGYFISNRGQLKSQKELWSLLMKPSKDKDNYLRVCLYKKGKRYYKHIHSLVLEAFIGPCPDGFEANHKDGNKQNNEAINLEWITHSKNIQHSYDIGLRMGVGGQKGAGAKLKDGEVWLIKKLLFFDMKRKTICQMFKITHQHLWIISTERIWAHIVFKPTEKDKILYMERLKC